MPTHPPARRPSRRTGGLPVRLLGALTVAALAATATVSLSGTTAGATVRAATGGRRTTGPFSASRIEGQATRALEQAQALFGDGRSTPARRTGDRAVGRREPTLVLRDLARLAGHLPTTTQRATADRILARPDDQSPRDPNAVVDPKYRHGSPVGSDCSDHFCVHWVEDGSPNAVSDDGIVATVPAWVRTTSKTMEHVYGVEVGRLGYRPPLSDGSIGPEGDPADHIDVYLADLGRKGIYGYCTSDQPDGDATRQVYGYCVLDNDYARTQFPVHSKLQNLQVTAAHEFFHLVQFGYDWWEDPWLMEGTAAWMEDEVYDGVDDNRQYLAESPLSNPFVPLDYTDGTYQPYGAWIFWRFLSEWSRPGRPSDPSVVRQVWEAAVGNRYSASALRKVLQDRHTSVPRAFAAFGTWIRDPGRYFTEGHAYRAAPLDGWFTLTSTHRRTGTHGTPLDHLSHSFVRFTPGSRLTGRWRLRVSVDMAGTARGSVAQLVVHLRSGHVSVVPVHLGARGNGTRTVGFRHGSVRRVELDLVNASVRFRCDQGTEQSCQGTSYDDGLRARFRATAVR